MATRESQEMSERFERAAKRKGWHPQRAETNRGLPVISHEFGEGGFSFYSVWVRAFFDDDGHSVHFVTSPLGRAKPEQAQKIKDFCNDANTRYRWMKFYLDGDFDVMCDADAIISDITCGDVCVEMTQRMTNVVDDIYKDLMKALWA